MNIILKWLITTASCVIFAGCGIRDGEPDCAVNVQLAFRFMTDDGTDRFGEQISSMSVFVFDGNRKFVGRWDDNDNTKFNTGYTMSLPLPPGDYSFVAWGGLKDECYYLSAPGQPYGDQATPAAGVTSADEILLRLMCDTRDSYGMRKNYVDYVPSDLFFGRTVQLPLTMDVNKTVTVDLIKNSKRINLTVIGLPKAGISSNDYSHMDIYIDAPNGGYDFRNDPENNNPELTWVQHDAVSGVADIQTSTIHSLRMLYGRKHSLTIYNTITGKAIYTADLLDDYISKVPEYSSQEAVDSEDEFDITINLTSSLGANVTVNGWDIGVSGGIIQ